MRPHRQYGQAGGPASCVQDLSACLSRRSQPGDNKTSLTSRPQGCSLTTPVHGCPGNRVFIAPVWAYLSTVPAGQGQFHAWARGVHAAGGWKEGGIAVVGNPAAPLWRWVNSSKIWTVNCRESSALHWCYLLMLTSWIKGGTSLQHETTVARTQNMCRCISQKDSDVTEQAQTNITDITYSDMIDTQLDREGVSMQPCVCQLCCNCCNSP